MRFDPSLSFTGSDLDLDALSRSTQTQRGEDFEYRSLIVDVDPEEEWAVPSERYPRFR